MPKEGYTPTRSPPPVPARRWRTLGDDDESERSGQRVAEHRSSPIVPPKPSSFRTLASSPRNALDALRKRVMNTISSSREPDGGIRALESPCRHIPSRPKQGNSFTEAAAYKSNDSRQLEMPSLQSLDQPPGNNNSRVTAQSSGGEETSLSGKSGGRRILRPLNPRRQLLLNRGGGLSVSPPISPLHKGGGSAFPVSPSFTVPLSTDGSERTIGSPARAKPLPSLDERKSSLLEAELVAEMSVFRQQLVDEEEFEFALVLKPDDAYAEAAIIMQKALELFATSEGALPSTLSERSIQEGGSQVVSDDVAYLHRNISSHPRAELRKSMETGGQQRPCPPLPPPRPRRNSTSLEEAIRNRLSLVDDMNQIQEQAVSDQEDPFTRRRQRELDRKKQQRYHHFQNQMEQAAIVRRHRAHHRSDEMMICSTNRCASIQWKPLLPWSMNALLRKIFKHIIYDEAGSLQAESIIGVLAATDPDPYHAGLFGTRSFRQSADIPNPARSFSILYSDDIGTHSLDLECRDDKQYAILFQGFVLLCMQSGRNVIQGTKLGTRPVPPQPQSTRAKWSHQQQRQLMRPHIGDNNVNYWHQNTHVQSDTCNLRLGELHVYHKDHNPTQLSPKPFLNGHNMQHLSSSTGSRPSSFKSKGRIKKALKKAVSTKRKLYVPADPSAPPPAYFLGWHSRGTQVWSRLRMSGLDVERLYHVNTRQVMLRIRLPVERMEAVAERMRLRLRRRDGTFGRFKVAHRHRYAGAGYGRELFKSSASLKVIDYIIRSKIQDGGAEMDARTEPGSSILSRLPLHNKAKLDELYGLWVTFWRPKSIWKEPPPPKGVLEMGIGCIQSFVSKIRFLVESGLYQPLELVAEYFGESIAFYFAWMGFYTRWLVLPSIVGFIYFCIQMKGGKLDNPIGSLYSIFIMCWSSAFLVMWRRYCSELAYCWGVLGVETEEHTRTIFKGKVEVDAFTGESRIIYPLWKRLLKFCVTVPIAVGFTSCILVFVFKVLVSNNESSSRILSELGWARMLVSPCLYGLLIPILFQLCKIIMRKTNDFENYRTDSEYSNAFIVKVFFFRFATVFSSMYYYAFVSPITSESGNAHSGEFAMVKLLTSLACFMTVGQWWYMIWMTYIPYKIQQFLLNSLRGQIKGEAERIDWGDDASGTSTGKQPSILHTKRAWKRKLLDEASSPLWEEEILKEYDPFDDYTMSLIQFGYVTLFSMAFPLAPLLALINNLIQTRVDAFKLCKTRRRPIAQKTSGIGVWDHVLEIMTIISVFTNCALVGFTSTTVWKELPPISNTQKALLVVLIEHMLLFLKYWLENLVPRIPSKVIRAVERDQFVETKRRENHRRRNNIGSASSPNSPMMREGKKTKNSTEQGVGGEKTIIQRHQGGGVSPSLVHLAGNQLPLFLASPLLSPTTDTPLLSSPPMLLSPRFLSPSNSLVQLGGSEAIRQRHHWERPEMNDIGFKEQISTEYNVLESETDSESTISSSSSNSYMSSDGGTDVPRSPDHQLN